MARAEAGQRIDELLDEIAELQQSIDNSPAVTLQDAAVKLRRLSVCVGRGRPARLPDSGSLSACEPFGRGAGGRGEGCAASVTVRAALTCQVSASVGPGNTLAAVL